MPSCRFPFALAALFAIAASACGTPSPSDPPDPPDRATTIAQGITGGTPDDANDAIVWIVAEVDGKKGNCSGVVVSPHVVLTAGHCSSLDAKYGIFLGSDYTDEAAKAKPENLVAVVEHRAHPEYDAKRNLGDIGVLVTSAPIPRKPIALGRVSLETKDVGRAVRIVGFGRTLTDGGTIGRRHVAQTKIAEVDATGIAFAGLPNICLFDSGGPTLMEQDGVEVVVGIHSIVDSLACNSKGWDTRVDPYVAFVEKMIAKTDPPAEDAGADAAEEAEAGTVPPPPTVVTKTGSCSAGRDDRSAHDSWASLALSCVLVAVARRRRRRSALEREVRARDERARELSG
jgi:V8-like Glu-specific endopeptidase